MKSTLLFTSTLLYTFQYAAFAQFESIKEKENKWQIGVNINTVEPITEAGYDVYFGQIRLFNDFDHQQSNFTSFGLYVSYFVQKDLGIRLSVKSTKYKIDETYHQQDLVSASPQSKDYIIDTGSLKQSTLVFSPGVFWNFKHEKLNIYVGFQVVYRKYNPAYEHLIYRVYDTQTNTLLSHIELDIKLEGGYSIGIAPFVGFSANIFRGISVGAEFSSAYSYYKTGGTLTLTQFFYPSGIIDGITNKATYEAYKFSSIISTINISYVF